MKEPNDDTETTKEIDNTTNTNVILNSESHVTTTQVQVQQHHHHPSSSEPFLEEDDHPDDPHKKRTWEESFALLQAYQKRHGHCQVPIRFEQDQRLGRWVYSQRVRRDKLTADQIRRLEELGFVLTSEQPHDHDTEVAVAVDRDENDRQGTTTTTHGTNNGPSHEALEEEEEEEDDEEEGGSSSAPLDDDDELGFTHTGRMRKAVKRYGITDNDDESDIARRKKELGQLHHPTKKHPKASTVSAIAPQPTQKVPAPSKVPAPPATPFPPILEEDEDDEEEEEEEVEEAEDPDYDSAEERKAREKRRKQRQKEEQAAAAQAATNNKRGRPKGRPRGRPRKETLQEKLEQIKVGSRVAVLWPAENEFYRATVAKVVPTRKRPYYLEYDDGETEWIDFATGQTEFLVLSPRNGPRKRNRSKAAKSTASAVASSSSVSHAYAYAQAHPKAPNRTPPPPPARSTSPKNTTSTLASRHPHSATSRNHQSHYSNSHSHSSSNSPQNVPCPDIKVGQKVSVYWSDDEQYYEATVVKQRKDRNHSQPHKLEYEDGEYEWIDLHQVKFRFLDIGDNSVVSPVRKSGRRRRLPSRIRETDEIVEDDSSDDNGNDDSDDEELEDDDDEPTRTTRVRHVNDGDLEDSSSSDSSSSSTSSTGDEDSDIELVSDVKQVHVGARVAVYWSDEERYFEGTVTDHRRGHPRPFFMQYDDGDTQWLDLRTRNFCVLKKVQRRSERRPRGRKRSKQSRRGSGSSASSAAEAPRRASSVGGRFTLCRQAHGRKAAANVGRAKCLSPTPTETSDTTDDEREQRIGSLAVPNPMKEIELSTRVAVFCPVKGKFLDGTITHRQIPRNSRKKPCYYVEYDKGHREWIELPKRKVRILKGTGLTPIAPKIQSVKRGRKRKPHDSPLLRMLREKEARKANSAHLALEDDDDEEEMEEAEPEKLAAVPEADQKLETSDEGSSSESDDISNATSEDEMSDQDEPESEAAPKKPPIADQIGIGTRIAVQCPRELKFMEGTVTRLIRNRRKPFYVEYDIGGYEWIDVHTSTIKLLTKEEEKLLKEQSAIVVKEEVEDALPVIHNLICDFTDDDDDGDKDVMDVDTKPPATKKTAKVGKCPPKSAGSNQGGDNNAANKITDVVMADVVTTSKATPVEPEQKQKPKHASEECGMPPLQDEDVVPVFASASAKAPTTQIIPVTCNTAKASTASKPSPHMDKIDVPRVSDSEGASISEKDNHKDSPTGVASVLGSGSSSKVCKGVASGASLTIPEMKVSSKQAAKCSSNLAEASDVDYNAVQTVEEQKTAAISTTTNSSSVDLVRVAPVAIVSETSTDDRGKDTDAIALNGHKSKIAPLENVRRVSGLANDNEAASQTASNAEKRHDVAGLKPDSPSLATHHGEHAQSEQSEGGDPESSSKEINLVGTEAKRDSTNHKEIVGKNNSEEDVAANGEQVRLRRGRPAKNRPVSSTLDDGKNASEKTLAVAESNEIDGSSQPPQKRASSRQSKSVYRKASWEATSEASGSPVPGVASDSNDGASRKRGPGRPSNSASKPERSVTNGSHEEPVEKHESKQHASMPKKRGPGRPPKRKQVIKIDSDDEKHVDPTATEPPKKRGPGRPSKHLKNGMSEDVTPKKRGPGRPRKEEANSDVVFIQDTPAKKRGPGRPRKSEGQETKKRGPGRPRKTPQKDDGDDESSIEHNVFNVTTVNGSRARKEPNRFSPTNFGDSDSDSSSTDTEAKGKMGTTPGSTPFKKSEFGAEHRQKANQIEVGMRVSVYWGGDQEYYPGTVTKERSYRKKKFFLEYDDGESEWIDFHRNKFHILTPPKNGGGKKKKPGEVEMSTDEENKPRRKSTDSETDPSNLIRNRMDMADVMLRIKIGSRVEVFWSEDDCFYPGTITKQRENIIQAKKPFFLEYDDGESEWIDLSDHVFRVIASNGTVATPDGVASSEVIVPAVASKEKRKKENHAEESVAKKQKRVKKN